MTSRTLLQVGAFRIDVENPAPGIRPGQLHLEDASGGKFLYDFEVDQFVGLPRPLAEKVADDPAVTRAVGTGRRYLGFDGGS